LFVIFFLAGGVPARGLRGGSKQKGLCKEAAPEQAHGQVELIFMNSQKKPFSTCSIREMRGNMMNLSLSLGAEGEF